MEILCLWIEIRSNKNQIGKYGSYVTGMQRPGWENYHCVALFHCGVSKTITMAGSIQMLHL